jgi:hypothetical protein
MWGRFGRSSTQRSEGVKSRLGALGNVRGRFGRQEPKQAQLPYTRAAALGVGALVVIATISLLLLQWRRARSRGSNTEEVNEEANAENEESAG